VSGVHQAALNQALGRQPAIVRAVVAVRHAGSPG
jgi:hypothetical protein